MGDFGAIVVRFGHAAGKMGPNAPFISLMGNNQARLQPRRITRSCIITQLVYDPSGM
jgi:hypothetical protein